MYPLSTNCARDHSCARARDNKVSWPCSEKHGAHCSFGNNGKLMLANICAPRFDELAAPALQRQVQFCTPLLLLPTATYVDAKS